MNKVAEILNKVGSVLFLNILFLLTSALTLGLGIGTCWTALIATYLDLSTDNTGYYVRNYFKHCIQELKETIVPSILFALVLVGAYFLLAFINSMTGGTLKTILFVVSLAVLLEIALVASFFFPVCAKFQGDWMEHLNLAFWFAHRYIYLSVVFVALFVGSLYLIVYVSFAFLFVCFGLIGFLEAKILKRLWREYQHESE